MEDMSPTQARAVRTRAALLAASAASFSEHGWEGTTAKAIALRAEVSVGTFYTYFPDKGAALRELASERFASVLGGMSRHLAVVSDDQPPDQERARHVLTTIVREVIHLHRHDPGLHAVYTERRHVDPELDALTSAVERTIVDGLSAMLAHWTPLPDPEATAFVCFGLVEGTVHAHVLGRQMVDDERLEAATVASLLRIITPLRGSK